MYQKKGPSLWQVITVGGSGGWLHGVVKGGGAVVGLQDGANAAGGPAEVIGLLRRQVREPGGRTEGGKHPTNEEIL